MIPNIKLFFYNHKELRFLFLGFFGLLSAICFFTECYEIICDTSVSWSDHLHNLIDHIMYLVVNYISFKVAKNGK